MTDLNLAVEELCALADRGGASTRRHRGHLTLRTATALPRQGQQRLTVTGKATSGLDRSANEKTKRVSISFAEGGKLYVRPDRSGSQRAGQAGRYRQSKVPQVR